MSSPHSAKIQNLLTKIRFLQGTEVMTPKQRAHEAIHILYTQRSHTQVFMITEEVHGVPLSKKLTFNLTLFPLSRYYYSPIIFLENTKQGEL